MAQYVQMTPGGFAPIVFIGSLGVDPSGAFSVFGNSAPDLDFPAPADPAHIPGVTDNTVIIIPFGPRPVPISSGAGTSDDPGNIRLLTMPSAGGGGGIGTGGIRIGGGGGGNGGPSNPPRPVLSRTSYAQVAGTDALLDVAAERIDRSISNALIVVGEDLFRSDQVKTATSELAGLDFQGRVDRMTWLTGAAFLSGIPSSPAVVTPTTDFDILRLTPADHTADNPLLRYWFFGEDPQQWVTVSYRPLSPPSPSEGDVGQQMYLSWRQRAWKTDLQILGGLAFQNHGAIAAGQFVDPNLFGYEQSLALRLEAEDRERAAGREEQPSSSIFDAVWAFFDGVAQFISAPEGFDAASFLERSDRLQEMIGSLLGGPGVEIIAEPR